MELIPVLLSGISVTNEESVTDDKSQKFKNSRNKFPKTAINQIGEIVNVEKWKFVNDTAYHEFIQWFLQEHNKQPDVGGESINGKVEAKGEYQYDRDQDSVS